MRSIVRPLVRDPRRALDLPAVSVMLLLSSIRVWTVHFSVYHRVPTALGVSAPGSSGGTRRRGTRVLLAQRADRALEVLERVEGLVDGREAQVRDLVALAQRREDRHAHLVRVDLGAALPADDLLDALGEEGQLVLGDRAALARLADTGEHLGPAERLGRARPLRHRQARALERREAPGALGALTTATDRAAIIGGAAVDDAGVGVPAERTVHLRTPFACVPVDEPVDDRGDDPP